MTVSQKVLIILLLTASAGCSNQESVANAPERSEHSALALNSAAITPQAAQNAGIETAIAEPKQIRTTLTLFGSIKTSAERLQDIRARYPGVVQRVNKRIGDEVAKGAELLTVESSESLQIYAVRSPLGGRVLDRATNPGDAVDSSTVLMRVADLSTVWVEFAVFARDLAHVRPGMKVFFRGVDSDESGEATLSYVAPAGQDDSQSVIARAVIDNRAGRWVPGQFVSGDVVIADVNAAVAVEPAALQELRGKTVVFVQNDRGFEARPVNVGRRARDALEIVNGVNAGERYAAKNSYLIKADVLKSEVEED
jgi:cobalt-zinc-cadmium efflux system membrane fusion protein